MFIARYKQFVLTGRTIASRLIAITIATSFLAVLLPIAVASATNTMACCIGKTAGHCESGIAAEKVPEPEPEPMCGLTNPHEDDDEITIVAESAKNHPHQSAETSSSGQTRGASGRFRARILGRFTCRVSRAAPSRPDAGASRPVARSRR